MDRELIMVETAASVRSDYAILKNKRCLVVEDNPQNTALFIKALSHASVITQHAFNGKEALELIDKNDFDFAVMDLQMPVMDGFEAIDAIRQRNDGKRDLKVIVVTAFRVENIRSKCLLIGFNEFMYKPFTPENLIAAIAGMLLENKTGNPLQSEEEDQHDAQDTLPFAGVDLEIDLSYLKSFTNGDDEFEKEILETSIEEIDQSLCVLSQYIQPLEVQQIREHSHTLKSLFAIVGIAKLQQMFAAIEKGADAGMNVLSTNLYTKIKENWENAKAMLVRL